jgi:hypothetical protein
MYMLQRAYYGVKGKYPIATSYHDYIVRCWIPLLFRFVVESGIYWATFTPALLEAGLKALGWQDFAATVDTLSKYGPVALGFGLCMDFFVDFSVTKVPILKDIWPQMPSPLPQPTVVQAQVVEQETRVTQLQTTTTVVPNKPGV